MRTRPTPLPRAVACAVLLCITAISAMDTQQHAHTQEAHSNATQQLRVDGAHGVDSPSCGPPLFPPCRTIPQAIDNAAAGDTVIVSAGSYECSVNGTVVDKPLALWADVSDGPVIVDCKGTGRAFVFRGVSSADVRGFSFRNGLSMDASGGSALAFFISGSTITDTFAAETQRNRSRDRHRQHHERITSPLSIVTITVSDCVFDGHVNLGGAAVVIQSFDVAAAIEGNHATFRNCSFTNNSNVASTATDHASASASAPSSLAINNAAGAVAVTYIGNVVGYCSVQFIDCDFIANSGGSSTVFGGAGGVSIVYVASGWIALMSESFIRCRFIDCSGGNANGAAGAGALSVLYQAITTALNFVVTVELSSFLMADVLVKGCSGGNSIRAGDFTQAGFGAAGGVAIVQSAGVFVCTDCAQAANASLHANSVTISSSVIQACSGGNWLTSSQENGGTASAGGIAISQTAVAGDAADLQHNTIIITNSSVRHCNGGSSIQMGTGGAGGIAVVQQISAGSTTYPPLAGSVLVSSNIHRFSDLIVHRCSGGNAGNGIGVSLGAGGLLLAIVVDEIVDSLIGGITIDDIDQTFERVEISECDGGSQNQNAPGLGTAVAGAGGLLVWTGAVGTTQLQGRAFPLIASRIHQRFSHLNVSYCSGASSNYASSGHVTAAAGLVLASMFDAFTSMALNDCAITIEHSVFVGNQGVTGSWGGSTANLAGAVAISLSFANAGVQSVSNHSMTFDDVLVDSNAFGTQYAATTTAVASGGISVALLMSAQSAAATNVSLAFQSVEFINNRAGVAISGATSVTAAGVTIACAAITMQLQSFAAVFDNCTWISNQQGSSEPGLDAGAVSVVVSAASSGSTSNFVSIRNSTLYDNLSLIGGGLRIEDVQGGSQLELEVQDTLFAYNFALCPDRACCCSGGAVSLTNVEAQMTRANFTGNLASYSAGALFLSGASSLLCDQCTLAANDAQVVGQIIQLQSQLNVTFTQSQIDMGGSEGTAVATAALSGFANQFSFTDNTVLQCGPGAIVVRTSNSFGCELCSAGKYIIGAGTWTDSGATHSKCTSCPFGAQCLKGADVRAVVGFWGEVAANGSVVLTPCAPEYCCTAGEARTGACSSFDPCRTGRTGVLCGECIAGHSEALGTTACRSDSDCHDAAWFIPLMLILGTAMSAYFVSLAAAEPVSVSSPASSRAPSPVPVSPPLSPTTSSGLFQVIVYFFQLAPFMALATNRAGTSLAVSVVTLLGDLFSLHPTGGSSGGGVCLVPGMKAVEKEAAHLCTPIFIALPFLMWIAIIRRAKRRQREAAQKQQWQIQQAGTGVNERLLTPHRSPSGSQSCCGSALFAPLRLRISSVVRTPLSATLLVGLLRIVLFTYATLVAHVFSLLQCVPIGERDGHYLLQAAYVKCFQPWQQALVALVVIMFAFPALLAWLMRPQRTPDKEPAAASSVRSLSSPGSLRRALVCSLGSPYRPGFEVWESLLVLLRLVVATVATFVPEPVVRLLLLFLCCGGMLLAHVHARPFRVSIAQHTQTAALAALMILTLLSAPAVSLSANASVVAAASSSVFSWFVWLQLLCLFLPLLVLGCALIAQRKACCPCGDSAAKRRPTQVQELPSDDSSSSHEDSASDAVYTAINHEHD